MNVFENVVGTHAGARIDQNQCAWNIEQITVAIEQMANPKLLRPDQIDLICDLHGRYSLLDAGLVLRSLPSSTRQAKQDAR